MNKNILYIYSLILMLMISHAKALDLDSLNTSVPSVKIAHITDKVLTLDSIQTDADFNALWESSCHVADITFFLTLKTADSSVQDITAGITIPCGTTNNHTALREYLLTCLNHTA